MNCKSLLLFLLPFILFACGPNAAPEQQPQETNWISLFNGKDLDGWVVKISGYEAGENFGNTFRVEDSLLMVRYDQYDTFGTKFGALHYQQPFSNYRLKVEYRFVGETAPGGPSWGFRDSGVQYHGQSPQSMGKDQSFPICLEYNLHGGNGTDERPVGQICANGMTVEIDGRKNESYCTDAKVKRTLHGDQWVSLEIDVQDGQIRHFVNGEEILAFTNPRYNAENEIAKGLIANGDTTVTGGYISLQSNSHPIDFRRIDIMPYDLRE